MFGAKLSAFLIAHAQYINFELSWAQGLKELLEVLGDLSWPDWVGIPGQPTD
jgi:hypothetical protein